MAYQPGLQEGSDITGAAMPAGGASGRGWLSAIWKAITDRLPAALVSGRLDVNIGATGVTQPVSGSVSVSNLTADQLVHAVNIDIAISALRDAITTAITQAQTAAGGSLPATTSAVAGYDADQTKTRPIPVAMINGIPRLVVDDDRTRQEVLEMRLLLEEMVDLARRRID